MSLANQSSSQSLKGQARCVSSTGVAVSPMRSEGRSKESEQWGGADVLQVSRGPTGGCEL